MSQIIKTISSLDVTVTTAGVEYADTSGAILWVNVDYYDTTGAIQTLEKVKIKDPPITKNEVMNQTVDLSKVQAVGIRSMALSITGATPGGENDGFIPSSVNTVAHFTDGTQSTIVDETARNFPHGGGVWPTPNVNSDWLDGNQGGVLSKIFYDNPEAPAGVTVIFTNDPFVDVYLCKPFVVHYPEPGNTRSHSSCQVWLKNKRKETAIKGNSDCGGLVSVYLWTNDVPDMVHHDTYPNSNAPQLISFASQLAAGATSSVKTCEIGISNDAQTQTQPEVGKDVTITLYPVYSVSYQPSDLDVNHELSSQISLATTNNPGALAPSMSVLNDDIMSISFARSPRIEWSTAGDRTLATYNVNVRKINIVPVKDLSLTIDTDLDPNSTTQSVFWKPVDLEVNGASASFSQPDIYSKTYPDFGWGPASDSFSIGWVCNPILGFRKPAQQLSAHYNFTISYSVDYTSENAPDGFYAGWTSPVPAEGTGA